MRRAIALSGAMAIAGCVAVTDGAETDTCGASDYQSLVGANIAAVTLPADLNDRLIRPGDMVTMDFDPTRINFRLDGRGHIIAIDCG